MPAVFVATMVKNEIDIVGDWIEFHARLFGGENIHVVDNMSTDGTWEFLQEMEKNRQITISRHEKYTEKGVVMTKILRERVGSSDFVIPLDIDEFLVSFNGTPGGCVDGSRKAVMETLEKSPRGKETVLSFEMITPLFDEDVLADPNRARECGHPRNVTRGSHWTSAAIYKKKFFRSDAFLSQQYILDHGNHGIPSWEPRVRSSGLAIVHYSRRGPEHEEKKVLANMGGLGYDMTLQSIKRAMKSPNSRGNHYFGRALKLLNGTGLHSDYVAQTPSENDVDVTGVSKYIL